MGESVNNASPSIKEYFNELFTHALSIGMSSHDFWEEDCSLLLNYVEAEKMRQKRKNTECWLNGVYVMYAVGANLSKNAHYPRKPILLTQEEIDEENNLSLLRLKEELEAEAGRK